MSTHPISIVVVDDHPVARRGVIEMLREHGERFVIAGEASDPAEAIAKVEALRPDVVLTDLLFKGSKLSGIDLIKELGLRLPATRSVLMTGSSEIHFMVEAFKAGAKAFLYKDAAERDYVKAIEAASESMTHFPATLWQELEKWSRAPRLTPSEERLLPYLAKGLTSKEVAREYNHVHSPKTIESRTVDQHKGNIKQKVGIDSSGGLVAFAIRYCSENGLDHLNLQIHTKR